MSLYSKFMSFFKKDERKVLLERYGAITYCECGVILQENSTMETLNEDGLYQFTCGSCGAKTYFHYGLAPVPIAIKDCDLKDYL